jgi:hypothetical protein
MSLNLKTKSHKLYIKVKELIAMKSHVPYNLATESLSSFYELETLNLLGTLGWTGTTVFGPEGQ